MAAVVVRQSQGAISSDGKSLVFTLSDAPAPTNLLVMVAINWSSYLPQEIAGWTLVAPYGEGTDDACFATYQRVVQSGDPATWTMPVMATYSPPNVLNGIMYELTGYGDPGDPGSSYGVLNTHNIDGQGYFNQITRTITYGGASASVDAAELTLGDTNFIAGFVVDDPATTQNGPCAISGTGTLVADDVGAYIHFLFTAYSHDTDTTFGPANDPTYTVAIPDDVDAGNNASAIVFAITPGSYGAPLSYSLDQTSPTSGTVYLHDAADWSAQLECSGAVGPVAWVTTAGDTDTEPDSAGLITTSRAAIHTGTTSGTMSDGFGGTGTWTYTLEILNNLAPIPPVPPPTARNTGGVVAGGKYGGKYGGLVSKDRYTGRIVIATGPRVPGWGPENRYEKRRNW